MCYDIEDAHYYLVKVNMILEAKGRSYRYAIREEDADNDSYSLTYGVFRKGKDGRVRYYRKDYVFMNMGSEELCHCLMGMFLSLAMH